MINSGAARRRATQAASGPTVQISASTRNTESTSNPNYAGITLRSTGQLYGNSFNGSAMNSQYLEFWLESGSASQVWVERVEDAGSLDVDDIGASRVTCNQQLDLYVIDTDPGFSSQTCTVTLNFYDAASAGNLLHSKQLTFSANYSLA